MTASKTAKIAARGHNTDPTSRHLATRRTPHSAKTKTPAGKFPTGAILVLTWFLYQIKKNKSRTF
ncbi:hypothetical protein TH468_18155 [Thalassospira sp. MCCC 1A03138]|nr:hypothetical protein TH468_18155 [Thalassospira sp. MCCC 1A03138]